MSFQDVKRQISRLTSEVNHIRSVLLSKLFGQDNAVNAFVKGYFQARMNQTLGLSGCRPSAVFLFAGPPGVGKTFLAETVAQELGIDFMRFDMSEYSSKESSLEFCGVDSAYSGAKPGNVTSFVEKNPQCVLLFDELEKAHPRVIALFLQMLDGGRLRDNYTDREVSFSNALIFFTTNAGKQLYTESESGEFASVPGRVIINALKNDVNEHTGHPFFPEAICSRFALGNVVMFNRLNAHNLRSIVKNELQKNADALEDKMGINISVNELVYTAILLREGGRADARTVVSRARAFFNDELYDLLRLISTDKVKVDIGNINKLCINVELGDADDRIKRLFTSSDGSKLIMFANEEFFEQCKSSLPNEVSLVRVSDKRDAEAQIDLGADFAVLDMDCDRDDCECISLDIEDISSPARDILKMIREKRCSLPVYVAERDSDTLSEEEKISLMRQGVRGFLPAGDVNECVQQLVYTAQTIHRERSMIKLARENKVLTFETKQTVSDDGKVASIALYDFDMQLAVDCEDAGDILSAIPRQHVCFNQIIGAEDAKKDLQYYINYLKAPENYARKNRKPPKGVLLHGPAGTGKTMLARAMACETGVSFIATEGSRFLKKYVGEGPQSVRELFMTARKYAPCILFIDEIDAVAGERSGKQGTDDTLTALLTQMDGFNNDPSRPVIVLAATNYEIAPGTPRSLDPALLRRFDRTIYIGLPGKSERLEFLKRELELSNLGAVTDKQLVNVADRSAGMSLADLENVISLAQRLMTDGDDETVDCNKIFDEAFESFNGGERRQLNPAELKRIAIHEAGHALLCRLGGERLSYITIAARDKHAGYMRQTSDSRAVYTASQLKARMRTLLGGRAAEIVFYGEFDGVSTGAGGDLAAATRLAAEYLGVYGMDSKFGIASLDSLKPHADNISAAYINRINSIMSEQLEKAIAEVEKNKAAVEKLANELIAKCSLRGDEAEAILTI